MKTLLLIVLASSVLAGCNGDEKRAQERRLAQMAQDHERRVLADTHAHEQRMFDKKAETIETIETAKIESRKELVLVGIDAIRNLIDSHGRFVVFVIGGVVFGFFFLRAVNGIYFRWEDGRERRGRYESACALIESLPDSEEKRAAITQLASSKSVLQLGHDEGRS